jgi:outer membrane protein assembly complex protein YaeT
MKARLALLVAGCAPALLALGCRATGEQAIELPFELVLAFEGAESVAVEDLEAVARAELARLEVAQPDKAAVDDAAFALELFYRRRGHAHVRVDYEYDPGPPGPPRARFTVHEGPRVLVRELVIEGATVMTPAQLRAFFGPMASGGAFDELRLEDDLDELRENYRDKGHLRVAVEPPEIRFDEDDTRVAVRIALTEGPVFRVTALDFSGGVPELAAHEAELARQHGGDLYKPVVLPQIEHALSERYQQRGHADARVRVRAEPDEQSGDVRIVAEITPGERVRIAHFRIQGNVRTKDAAILGVLGIEHGSAYDPERLREAFRELYATGLFEAVELSLEGTGPERTLVIDVSEARFVQIRIEPGWGSYEGPRVLLGIEDNNFQGRGQLLALEGTASPLAQGARIAWVDRDFLGTLFTSETTFFAERREEPSFDYVRRGFSFSVRRAWSEKWSSTLGYEYRPTDVIDASGAALTPDIESDTEVAALSAALAMDDRDNLLLPTRGRQGRARLEWADDGLGSDTEFLRAQLEFTRLYRLGEEGVLAASGRTGVIAPFGETDEIPLPERFFNGGENSVRSFEEDELLPSGASGDPLGGEASTTLNLEYRRMLTGNLAGALFVDWGNVTLEVQDYLDFDGFRTGVGVGLRYLLPIGPVRLDLAANPDPGDDEDDLVLHFSVGFPF